MVIGDVTSRLKGPKTYRSLPKGLATYRARRDRFESRSGKEWTDERMGLNAEPDRRHYHTVDYGRRPIQGNNPITDYHYTPGSPCNIRPVAQEQAALNLAHHEHAPPAFEFVAVALLLLVGCCYAQWKCFCALDGGDDVGSDTSTSGSGGGARGVGVAVRPAAVDDDPANPWTRLHELDEIVDHNVEGGANHHKLHGVAWSPEQLEFVQQAAFRADNPAPGSDRSQAAQALQRYVRGRQARRKTHGTNLNGLTRNYLRRRAVGVRLGYAPSSFDGPNVDQKFRVRDFHSKKSQARLDAKRAEVEAHNAEKHRGEEAARTDAERAVHDIDDAAGARVQTHHGRASQARIDAQHRQHEEAKQQRLADEREKLQHAQEAVAHAKQAKAAVVTGATAAAADARNGADPEAVSC